MLGETGDEATLGEVITLITDLRDEIASSNMADQATFPGNLANWNTALSDY